MRKKFIPRRGVRLLHCLAGGILLTLLQACSTGRMQMEGASVDLDGAVGASQQHSESEKSQAATNSDISSADASKGVALQSARSLVPPKGAAANSNNRLQHITWDLIAKLQEAKPDPMDGNRDLFTPVKVYRIGVGDVLAVVVWGHPELAMSAENGAAQGFIVSEVGEIQFPFLGKFRVIGMSESEAHAAITRALGRIIRNPQITLRVQGYRSQRIFIDGEVQTPGVYSVTDLPMNLPEALSRAGGAASGADLSRLQLNRKGKQHLINMSAFVESGINPSGIMLQEGDILRVPSRNENKVYVIGEVSRAMGLTLQNGRMTLNAALGEAAGVNRITGDVRQIYVIRTKADATNGAQPAVYHLDAKSPTALILAEQFELQPKDVVYVDASSLASWNRVISLILPSAGLVSASKNTLLD